jgi:hypothetical protein
MVSPDRFGLVGPERVLMGSILAPFSQLKGTVQRKLTGLEVISIERSSFRIEPLIFFFSILREFAL